MKQIHKLLISMAVLITILTSVAMSEVNAKETKKENKIQDTTTNNINKVQPTVPKKIQTQSLNVINNGRVLLIEDALPYGRDTNEFALNAIGINYDLIYSSDLETVTLSNYKFIIYAGDQPTSYYKNISKNIAKIENYAFKGGILVGHVADRGWQGGDWTGLRILPGGVRHVNNDSAFANVIRILDQSHPVVSGLRSEYFDLWDDSAHGYLTNLSAGTRTIMESIDADYNGPTYIEYSYGKGIVLATTQTFEWSNDRYPWHEINEFRYAEDLANLKRAKWSTIGSTGSVDDADKNIFVFDRDLVYIKSSASLPAILDVRYNVIAVDGLLKGNSPQITIRYIDNGAAARVLADLVELDINTGAWTNKIRFDSNNYDQKSGYQTRTIRTCNPGWTFDFTSKIYWVALHLEKTGSAGNPQLSGIQLVQDVCWN